MFKQNGCECCGCELFTDFYDNRGDGNLDEDGVNLPDGTRYSFAATTWHVDVGTGKLVCDADNELITFYGAGRYNIQVTVNLPTDGDYADIVFGGTSYVRVTRTNSTTVQLGYSGGTSFEITTVDATNYTLYALFFYPSVYGNNAACIVPEPTSTFLRLHPFLPCPQYAVANTFSNFSLRAKAGVEFDNLYVLRAVPECQNLEHNCASICWTPPESISVSISGALSGYTWCGPVDIPSECETDRTDCLVACGAFSGEAYCACVCACYLAYNACHCGYIVANGSCGKSCDCGAVNGEHVMDRTGDCSCEYSTTISSSFGQCDSTVEAPLTISATLEYRGCDAETGLSYVKVYVQMPFASPTVDYYHTGDILSSDFCEGGTLELQTYPEGATQYADEILLGCALGCGVPSGYGCGDGPIGCEYVDPMAGATMAYECAAMPYEFYCDHAEHTVVGVSDAEVIP